MSMAAVQAAYVWVDITLRVSAVVKARVLARAEVLVVTGVL